MSRNAAYDLILDTLTPAKGRAWHGGTTAMGAVSNVTAEEAHRRVAPGRKTIWELTLHIAYWKYAVRRHLEAEAIPRFPRSPSNWPAQPATADEAQWRADRALLAEEDRLFQRAARRFDPARLTRRPASKRKYTYGEMIAGVLAHDAYHTGQIQLLKRLP